MYTIQPTGTRSAMDLQYRPDIAIPRSDDPNGQWLQPGQPDYDARRRAWNSLFDRRPAMIARCHSSEEVAAAIRFATRQGLAVAVRSGGHSAAGFSTIEGGVLIDLSPMNDLAIDPARQVAVAGPGLTWGEYVAQTARYGLTTPAGDTASVGVGGLTLGGGIGWLARKYGMTIDHLIAAEVVTARGEIITASATDHPDLFWAIRGGGGNFGVVTRFTFGLVPVSTVLAGVLVYPAEPEILTAYARVAAAAPDEVTTIADLMRTPPMPFLSPDLYGKLHFQIGMCYTGDLDEGQRALAPLAALGPVRGRMIAPMPYPAIYKFTEEATISRPCSVRNHFLDALDEETARLLIDSAHDGTSPFSIVQIRPLGGQLARIRGDATAFAHREKPLLVPIINPWEGTPQEPSTRHQAWTAHLWQRLKPRSVGAYVGLQGDEEDDEASAHAAYPPATYQRLAAIKGQYDPDNLFRSNRNITPAR